MTAVCFFHLHFTQHPNCFGIRVVIKWLGSLFICISGYLKRCDDHMYWRLADKQMTCCSQQSLLHRLLSCDMLLRIFTDWSTNKPNTSHSFWPSNMSAKCIFFCVITQQIQGNQKYTSIVKKRNVRANICSYPLTQTSTLLLVQHIALLTFDECKIMLLVC